MMNGYIGMTEYTFPVEKDIYEEVLGWIAKYGVRCESSVEYSIPGAKFRMVTVGLWNDPQIVIKDVNKMLKNARHNNEWRKSKEA